MGILFLFLLGIVAILFVAKLASKVRPEEEVLKQKKEALQKKDPGRVSGPGGNEERWDALVSLLIKKQIFSENELIREIAEKEKKKGKL